MGTGTLPTRRSFTRVFLPFAKRSSRFAPTKRSGVQKTGVRQILGDGCWERGHLARLRAERPRFQAHLPKICRTPGRG